MGLITDQRVQIRVGETVFETTKATLAESQLFASKFASPAQPTTYFVDNDPELFRHIMRYLRTRIFPLFWSNAAGHDHVMYETLLSQAKFYQIPSLINWLVDRKYLQAVTKTMTVFERCFVGEGQLRNMDAYVTDGETLQITSLDIGAKEAYKCPAGIWKHDGKRTQLCFRAKCHENGDQNTIVKQRCATVEGILTKVVVGRSLLGPQAGDIDGVPSTAEAVGEDPPSYEATQKPS